MSLSIKTNNLTGLITNNLIASRILKGPIPFDSMVQCIRTGIKHDSNVRCPVFCD